MKFRPSQYLQHSLIVISTCVSILTACDNTTTPILSVKERMVIDQVGFSSPESAEYYPEEDVYLVSNVHGSSFAKDDNGFISKVKPDGTIIDLKWLNGESENVTLNAPKGMAISNRQLYVTDIDQVHVFSLPDGQQQTSITLPNTTFLNGITPGADNFVYVTDTGYSENTETPGLDGIYKVSANGQYETLMKHKDLGRPNGILAENEKTLFVTFGSNKIQSISSDSLKLFSKLPGGKLDGFLKLDDGRYLVSSWKTSSIYMVEENGDVTLLANTLDAPADLGFDTQRKQILVPLFKKNQVVILPLPTAQHNKANH